MNFYCRPTRDTAQLFQSTVEVSPEVPEIVKAALANWNKIWARCVDCGLKTDNLVKCSNKGCENQLCSKCADRYSGRHCNSCYVDGEVMMVEWPDVWNNPPHLI
jgi:hypothetical protein